MLDSQQTAQLLDIFGAKKIWPEPGHCLNRRYKDVACTLCAQTCPAQAIQVEAGQPLLDDSLCVNCGVCLQTCPTGVFSQRRPPEKNLIEVVSQAAPASLALACSWHPDPAASQAPAAVAVRHRRCLAALAPDQLLALSAGGQRDLWLDDSPCADCPIGQAQPLIEQSAAAANHLLAAVGRAPAIHLLSRHSQAAHSRPAPLPLLDGAQPQLSRRSFFGMFRKLAVEVATPADDPPPPTGKNVPVDQRLPHRTPPARRRLNSQLAALAPAPDRPLDTTPIPFTGILVDQQTCSACGLCATFCPTGALDFARDDGQFDLAFRPAICIDCGICLVACPEQAITYLAHLPAPALIDPESHSLIRGDLTACQQCGVQTAIRPGESGPVLCYACRKSAALANPLQAAGLLADLLGRDPHLTPGQPSAKPKGISR